MHPSSIISYYPTYQILDGILNYGNYNTLNFYFDLKNNMQTVYMEHAVRNILESSLKSRFKDASVFTSLISFMAFHKIYSIKRGLKINFFIFFETGASFYHTNIYKSYKVSRKLDDLYGLDREKRELFYEILQSNYKLIESACGRIPRIQVIRLHNLEADFIPYFLIKNQHVGTNPNVAHIVYSNDHDLLQTTSAGNNIFIFRKSGKIKKIVKNNEVFKECTNGQFNYPDRYSPVLFSIVGDVGDDIPGIKGLGNKRAGELIEEFIDAVNGVDELYENVYRDKNIFHKTSGFKNKYMSTIVEEEQKNNVISRNLKLISFELLTRFINEPRTLPMAEKREMIQKVLVKEKDANKDFLFEALEKNRVYLDKPELDILFSNI